MVFFTFSVKVDRVNLQINIFRPISWSIQAFLVFLAFLTFLVDLLRLKDLGNPHQSLMAFAGLTLSTFVEIQINPDNLLCSFPSMAIFSTCHQYYHKYGRRPKDQSRPCYVKGSINNVTFFL